MAGGQYPQNGEQCLSLDRNGNQQSTCEPMCRPSAVTPHLPDYSVDRGATRRVMPAFATTALAYYQAGGEVMLLSRSRLSISQTSATMLNVRLHCLLSQHHVDNSSSLVPAVSESAFPPKPLEDLLAASEDEHLHVA